MPVSDPPPAADTLDLTVRTGLPQDLRFLLARYPRPDWHAHPGFGPMTRFYLDRHALFRELQDLTRRELENLIERRRSPEAFASRFQRLARIFLGEIATHHAIEDHHYFPALARLEPRLARGFDLLEADHRRLHEGLEAYAQDANALLQALAGAGEREAAGAMLDRSAALRALIARHLEDEEELVVPVMLDRGEDALEL